MSDVTLAEVKTAVGALREELTKAKPDPAVMAKVNETLDKHEEQNQKIVTDLKASETREAEVKERMDVLEAELSRSGGAGESKNFKDSDEYKALQGWCIDGYPTAEQKAVLRTDNDTTGGFLVPTELDTSILKKITEISPMRSVARVRTISSKSMEIPIRASIPVATYEGEAASGDDSSSLYENETLVTFRQTFTTPITMDMLMDSAFDMESEIMADAREAFAFGEGLNFVVGDGVKKPSGFTADTRVQANARDASGSSTYTADDILLLTGDLKTGYNPVYALNRRELAFIRTLKSTDGNFLWQPGLNGVVASTLAGFNYIIMNDMPDQATDAFPIAFGDFLRGYTIVDRTGMSVVRDEFTQKKKAIIEFTMNRWNYGRVVLPEAIKLLKTVA